MTVGREDARERPDVSRRSVVEDVVRDSQVKPSNCFRLHPYVDNFQKLNNPGS